MITLGGRSFAGPFLLPLWSPASAPGLYAVLVPGWRLLTFRAVHFGQSGDLADPGLLKSHPRYPEWVRLAGTEWNLYVGTHEMSFSTPAQREAAERDLIRQYQPAFDAPGGAPQGPSLKTMLLAQALRGQRGQ